MATPIFLEGTEFDTRAQFYNQCQNIVADLVRRGCWFTKDDIKARVTVEPPHPNAWGSLHRQPWWRESVEWSGEVKASANRLSRGHIVKVWRPREVASDGGL